MIDVRDKHFCCGCKACGIVCKVKAISFCEDPLGFSYPLVDKNRCTGCNACVRACPFANGNAVKPTDYEQRAYAARHNDLNEISSSRSGAVFVALSDSVLNSGGVVYGAALDDQITVVHARGTTKEECVKFKGSKYTQSDLGGITLQIINDLDNNKTVLFSGTPCQVNSVKRTIPSRSLDRLITVDVICHGVASPKVWKDYISFLEGKEKKKIINANFRDKGIYGWSGLHKESFTYSDGIKRTYHYNFYQPYLLRPSCSKCPFANLNRCSDITIGDFWGIDGLDRTFNPDDTGCSLVICNTIKGERILMDASKGLRLREFDIMDCLQPNLVHPTVEDKRSVPFEKDYSRLGFVYVYKKYGEVGVKHIYRRSINLLNRLWKKIIKR